MKYNYKLFSIFASSVMLIFFYFHFTQSIIKNNTLKDSYIKNTKFTGVLKDDVAYNIGSPLEFYYILDSTKSGSISEVNLEKLTEKIDITSIQFGEKNIPISQKLDLKVAEITPLKITGISKVNNNIDQSNINDLIDVIGVPVLELPPIDEVEINQDTPKNIHFSPTTFSSNISNILEIKGENIKNITSINIDKKDFLPTMKDGKMYVFIEKKSIKNGNFIPTITHGTKKIILETSLNFNYNPSSVSLVAITPNSIDNTTDKWLVVQGDGFKEIISIQLNNNIVLKNTDFKVISNGVMQVKIPKDLPVGKYTFNILTSKDILNQKSIYFNVTL